MTEQGLRPPLIPLCRGKKTPSKGEDRIEMKEELNIDEQKSSSTGRFRGPAWMTADPMEYGILKENAKSNRKNMTEAESLIQIT